MRRPTARGWRLGAIAVFLSLAACESASAQWMYPYGYGGYGWSQWGADPGAGYLAGMGSYARGEGAYQVEQAKADAIERDSLIKWNKALAAQRRQQQAEQAVRDAQRRVQEAAQRAEANIESGATLNALLDQILEADPNATTVAAAKTPVTAELIRAIPFETASEPIAICLDQLTAGEPWPFLLNDPGFQADRQAIGQVVKTALAEDAKGEVSAESAQAVAKNVAALHDKFASMYGPTTPGYYDADTFLKTLAGLSGMLHNPSLEPVLKELETYEGGTIGELIAFMHTFNLRFGPAQDDRQRELYGRLAGSLQEVAQEAVKQAGEAAATGPLPSAAKGVFQGMRWEDLKAGNGSAPK